MQNFDSTIPFPAMPITSEPIRNNFRSLATSHSGVTPPTYVVPGMVFFRDTDAPIFGTYVNTSSLTSNTIRTFAWTIPDYFVDQAVERPITGMTVFSYVPLTYSLFGRVEDSNFTLTFDTPGTAYLTMTFRDGSTQTISEDLTSSPQQVFSALTSFQSWIRQFAYKNLAGFTQLVMTTTVTGLTYNGAFVATEIPTY